MAAVALAAAVLAPGALVGRAGAAASGPGVVLVVDADGTNPGTSLPISAAELADLATRADSVNETVTVYDSDGSPPRTDTYKGASIAQLLTYRHLNPAGVSTIDFDRGPGDRRSALRLSGDEVALGFTGDSRCGQYCQAVIAPSNGGELFRRPARAVGDPNGADDIAYQDPSTPMRIAVATKSGRRFTPHIAQPNTDDPGSITLTATGAPSGSTFSWSVSGDQCPPQQDTPLDHVTCTFPAGRFTVTAEVVGPDGESTGAAAVTFTLGHPSDGGNATTPVTPTDAASGGSGGNGTGGGTATSGGGTGGTNAPSSGPSTSNGSGSSAPKATTPTPTKRAKSTSKSGAAIPRSSDGKAGSSANSTTTRGASTTSGSGTTATPAAHTAKPSSTPAATTPTTPPATTPGTGATTPPVAAAKPPAPPTTRVTGKAVAGRGPNVAAALVAAEALAAAPPVPASEPVAARAAAGHGAQIAAGVTGAAVIIGLLGFGAAREMRRLPKRLPA